MKLKALREAAAGQCASVAEYDSRPWRKRKNFPLRTVSDNGATYFRVTHILLYEYNFSEILRAQYMNPPAKMSRIGRFSFAEIIRQNDERLIALLYEILRDCEIHKAFL